jgi:hypothetical protein
MRSHALAAALPVIAFAAATEATAPYASGSGWAATFDGANFDSLFPIFM